MAKKWMKKAFANSHGQFKAKAETAGESTRGFAEGHKHDGGKTGKQANLALVGMHHGKKKHNSAKHMVKQMYGQGQEA